MNLGVTLVVVTTHRPGAELPFHASLEARRNCLPVVPEHESWEVQHGCLDE